MGRYISCTHVAGSGIRDAAAIECDGATVNIDAAALRSHSENVKHSNGALGRRLIREGKHVPTARIQKKEEASMPRETSKHLL